MPISYQFRLDNGEILKHPTNWKSITLGYDFDQEVAGAKEISQLDWCDKGLLDTYLQILQTEACFDYILTIAYRCSPNDSFVDIFFTNLLLNRLTYECDGCEFNMPSQRYSLVKRLETEFDEELCMFATTDLQLFQVQSGGFILDGQSQPIERPFVSLLDFVNQFNIQAAQGAYINMTNLVFDDAATYYPAQIIVAPDAVPTGVTALTVTGEWGQKYIITIQPGSASIEEYLTRIAQAFFYVVDGQNISMEAWEFHARAADYDLNNTNDVLRVRFYYDITVILTVDGVTPTWFSQTDVTQQVKSSADIMVSNKGLQGRSICLEWEDLRELILKLTGGIIKEDGFNSDAYQFVPYSDLTDNLPTTGNDAVPITSANNVKKSFRWQWFKNRIDAGTEFRQNEFFDDSAADRWQWYGVPEYGFVVSSPTGPRYSVTVPLDCAGRVFGELFLVNNSGGLANIVIEFYIDGTKVDEENYTNIMDGDFIRQEIGDTVTNEFPAPWITQYTGGQLLELRWDASTAGVDLSTDPNQESSFVFLCLPGFQTPFLNEDTFYSIANGTMTDFAGCPGSVEMLVPEKFYFGLGFAISQQLQNLQDYDDTYFITYRHQFLNEARRFPKMFYWGSDATIVYAPYIDNFVSFNYYNAPLQLPNILMNLLPQIPSKVLFPAWEFTVDVDAAGIVTFSKDLKNVEIQGTGKKCTLEFDICGGVDDLVRALNYGSVNVQMCDENGTSIIEDLTFDMNDQTTTYKVII